MANRQEFYGWKLLAVLFSLDFINMGFPYYGGSVISSYMQIPMSRSTYGWAFTLINLFVGLAAVFVAMSIVKFGLRATFVIGSTLICCGSLFLGFYAYKPWHFLIAFGVVNGTGISFATLVPAATAVTRWFRRYRGRAMGIALSASGFAGLAASKFLGRMLKAAGGNWHAGWKIVACAAVLSGLMALLFVRESPESLGQTMDGISELEQSQPSRTDTLATKYSWTTWQAYGTSTYWLIVLASVAAQFPFFFMIAHWPKNLSGAGIAASDVTWAMGLLTMGTLVGRWLGGLLMDVMNARYAYMIGLCFYFLASFCALRVTPDSLWTTAYVASLLTGAAFGWTFTCMNTCTAHYYGPAAFPKLNGMMVMLTSTLASPAGAVGGKIFDRYGSYARAFEFEAVLAAVAILAMAFATMPKPRGASGATAPPARA
ncbi:MAG: MFS transporter [Acidobacteriia bacterium]|nr:MFS transporter [Terriglobia bacterium]